MPNPLHKTDGDKADDARVPTRLACCVVVGLVAEARRESRAMAMAMA